MATLLVDRLIVAVAINAGKDPLFALEERAAMVETDINALTAANGLNGAVIEVRPFAVLLMHFAHEHGADMVIRGLRAVSDFEYEFQMAANNKRLPPDRDRVPDGLRDQPVHLFALREGDPQLGRRRVELRLARRAGPARRETEPGLTPPCGPTCSISSCRPS